MLKINDGFTTKQRYIKRHKERLLKTWREAKRQVYQSRRELLKARSKAWREANPNLVKKQTERRGQKIKAMRLADPDWAKQHDKEAYAKYKNYYLEYNQRHRKKRRATAKKWYKKRPIASILKESVRRHRRRSLKKQAVGSFCEGDIKLLFRQQAGCCAYCLKPIKFSRFHIDHVVPLSKGGTNWRNNLALACSTCNHIKYDKLGWIPSWVFPA